MDFRCRSSRIVMSNGAGSLPSLQETVIPGFTSSHYEYLITSVKDKQRKEVRRRFNDFVVRKWYGRVVMDSWG